MKKNLPFYLLILFTLFADIYCNTVNQTRLLQYKTYCKNNNARKQPAGIFGNLIGDKLKSKKNFALIFSLSHPGDQYKENNKASDEMAPKETRGIDVITGGHIHKFFDNLIIYQYKKADDIMMNHVGQAGIVSGRLDFEFAKFSGKKSAKYHTISVSQKTEG